MKTILKVNFDALRFSGAAFEIINPSFLPLEGECFSADWAEFIKDQTLIDELNDFEDHSVFITNVVNKHYSRYVMEMIIVLVEEEEYRKMIAEQNSIANYRSHRLN